MNKGTMSGRQKTRLMKILVVACFVTLVCIFVAAYIGYWFGIDMDTWLTLGCGAFSLELAINACIKLFGDKDSTSSDNAKTNVKPPTKKLNG